MSLDKAIEHHKEKRKAYHGSKAIDATCRNHGSCKWCENNRKFKFRDKHPYNKSEEKMDRDDRCYECTGYGDDYYIDENGELVSACHDCPFNKESEYEDD